MYPRLLLALVLCFVALQTGCSPTYFEDLVLVPAVTANRNQEVIDFLEAKMTRGEQLSGYPFQILCDAYYKTRQYDRQIQTTYLLQKR